MNARSVMECGSSLPLFPGHVTLSIPPESARGLAQSKTWRAFAAPTWCLGVLVVCLFALSAHAQTNYAISWFKIAGGGGMQSTGGVYALSGTIGQIDAGRVAYTNAYRIEAGFWAIAIQQLGYPPLRIARADTNYFVSWLTAEPGMILQQATALGVPTSWSDVPDTVSTNGLTNLVQQALAIGVSNRYYRLRRP